MKRISINYFVALSTILTLLVTSPLSAQVCVSGAIYVTGAGCGCVKNCNLTSLGGPNCGPTGVSGKCNAFGGDGGCKSMSVSIVIPSTCQVKIKAEMKNRPPCTAGQGADGTCDNLRVDLLGGSRPFITGSGDASISDEITVTGPAILVVEGHANRSDEIITYTVTNVDPSCPSCSVVLPIRLLDFTGEQYDANSNALKWVTGTEINNHYFTLERSVDTVASHFETIAMVEGAGNSDTKREYTIIDQLPNENVSSYYYRLSQTDFDGKTEFFNPISIMREVIISTYFSEKELHVISNEPYDLKIMDVTGKLTLNLSNHEVETTDLSGLPQGVYIYNVSINGQNIIKKLVID